MSHGINKAGFFIFSHKGDIFESIYGTGKVQTFHFKSCSVKNGQIRVDELERYQMYVPIESYEYIFDKDKIYCLTEVYEGAYKEDKTGAKNLSAKSIPKEYSKAEFIDFMSKKKSIPADAAKKFLDKMNEIEKQDKKDADRRLGRLS